LRRSLTVFLWTLITLTSPVSSRAARIISSVIAPVSSLAESTRSYLTVPPIHTLRIIFLLCVSATCTELVPLLLINATSNLLFILTGVIKLFAPAKQYEYSFLCPSIFQTSMTSLSRITRNRSLSMASTPKSKKIQLEIQNIQILFVSFFLTCDNASRHCNLIIHCCKRSNFLKIV